ncbi:50S ribosomal protein L3 [Candidatus Nomurabacteria bacterium]|nr:50S ribosomal protein L3 [Candidatus Nomurabacteria bacterium]
MKFIIGQKLGMTQIFKDDGTVVPATRVKAGPCVVTQVKTKDKDGVSAVQVGFSDQKMFRLNKPQRGHLKDLNAVRFLRDFRAEDDHGLKRGDVYTVKIFEAGEKVQVVGKSKGKGFQGVVKRHRFSGSLKTHGHKDQHRMPGSIGSTGPARVFKGTRMGGHMGDDRVTVKNLEVVNIDTENNEIYIKGAVPGARGGLLLISTPEGKIEAEVASVEAPVEAVEAKEENVETPVEQEASVVQEEKAEEGKQEIPAAQDNAEESKEKEPEAATEEKTEEPKAEEVQEAPAEEEKK